MTNRELLMTPLQKGVQPRISRMDTKFLSGTGKAIRAYSWQRGLFAAESL